MRGRKPIPLEQRQVEGNKSHRAFFPMFDEVKDGDLVMPPEVYDDPEAKRYWIHFTQACSRGHLKPIDVPLMAEVCLTMSLLSCASAEISEYMRETNRVTVETKMGMSPHSAIRVRLMAQDHVIRLLTQLCLTPGERNRVLQQARKDLPSGTKTDAFFDDQANDQQSEQHAN